VPPTAPGTTSPLKITPWAYRGSSIRNYARRPWRRTVIRQRTIVVWLIIARWQTISRSRTISRRRFIRVPRRIAGRRASGRRPVGGWRWAYIRGSCAIGKGSTSGEQHCGGGTRDGEVAHDILCSRFPLSSSTMKRGAAQRLFVGRAIRDEGPLADPFGRGRSSLSEGFPRLACCTRSSKLGSFIIGRKTIKKRMRAKLLATKMALRRQCTTDRENHGIKRMLQRASERLRSPVFTPACSGSSTR
jgi:hypothetical protein